MPTLKIEFKKKADGTASMTCRRADGTSTGQKSGAFFLEHDLCHYAAELTLGLNRAFYGMISCGWDISDFGSPWPRGHFPPEAVEDLAMGEHCAVLLGFRLNGHPELAAEYQRNLREQAEQNNAPMPREPTEAQWQEMESLLDILLEE
jgi:hypothetical protein